MAIPAGLNRRYVFLLSGALITIWLWVAIDRDAAIPRKIISNVTPTSWGWGTSKQDVFDFPPVDSQALRDVCAATKWNSTLVFTCDNNHGGVGNVRNSILNCVRYAIAAGGSLVLPNIALREMEDHMGDEHEHEHIHRRHGPGRQGLEYMFDKNHFANSLRKSCPDLVLLRRMEQTASNRRKGLLPESLFENIPTTGIEHPEEWPRKLSAWIEKHMPSEPEKEPIIIDLEQSFLHYPTHSDGHAFAHTFGNILKFRSDVRVLATKTLHAMKEWYDLPTNISDRLMNPSFLGTHLGTENPFLEQRKRHNTDILFSHYNAQSAAYLNQATSSSIPLLYAASGNIEEVHKLALDATRFNIAVTHKEDLLKGKDMDELERLKYDQRALVDYLVLTKGQEFAGVGHSPFSWNIALAREQLSGHHEGKLGEAIWDDGLSRLYGVRGDYVASSACMWS